MLSLKKILDLTVVIFAFGTLPSLIYLEANLKIFLDYFGSSFFLEDESASVYDFIIVGGGSAGAVVTNRLSKHNKVLLLEAGGDPLFHNSIPGIAVEMLGRPENDWNYKTVPQENSNLAMLHRNRSSWPRGKLLGGTSNLNYMMYVRGNPEDYDRWATVTGDNGWSYENLLPFFKKSINYNGEFKENEKQYGQNAYGKLSVESLRFEALRELFYEAARELGLNKIDVNGPQKVGIGPIEVTQKSGQRWGTFMAFLKDIMSRTGLTIARYSQAIKIRLDKSGRAVGVWYLRHGKLKYARASKEVIISAGAIDSPKLLMLSGIGPKEHLQDVGIKPKVDLPVGKNLQDHIMGYVMPIILENVTVFQPDRDLGVQTFLDYFLRGQGPLVAPGGFNSQIFFCSSIAKCNTAKSWPDLQIFASSVGIYEGLSRDFHLLNGVDTEIINDYISPHIGKNMVLFGATLVLPKSLGDIKLKDRNPSTHPLIDPKYFDHPDDMKILLEGMKFAAKFVETKSFQRHNSHFPTNPFPGCEKHKMFSDAYWECTARQWAQTLYHPVGTCSMGRKGDPKAVLDSNLRVLNTLGLRVVDASIMPHIVNGNTNAPAIMIGEKGADLIRNYWAEQFIVCHAVEVFLPSSHLMCHYSKHV